MNPAAGLIHFAARDYQPSDATWLSADPHSGTARLDAYQYVFGDPVTLIDPDGRDPAPANCAGNVDCYNYYYTGTTPVQQCRLANGGDGAACAVGANGGGFYTPVVQAGDGQGATVVGGDTWAPDFQRPTPTIAQAQPGQHSGYYADPAGGAARYGQVAHGIDDWSIYWQQATNDEVNGMSAIWQNGHILCYGQAACDAAATYLKTYPSDTAGAAYVAANYCYIHPAACASYDRHRAIASAILLAGGTIAQGAYTGLGLGAAEIAAGGSKPFVMGIKDNLDDFAQVHGGTTWKSLPESQLPGDAWKSGVTRMLSDPNQRVLFNLDGVDVWGGVTRAAAGKGGATDWELLQIKYGDFPNLEFWQNGVRVGNPFG
jgi:hypothetical protein